VTEARLAARRHDLAMRAMSHGVYDWDIVNDTTFYSGALYDALGMSPDEFSTPRAWRDRIHPEDLPAFDAALVEHFKGRSERFECDYRYRAKDGAWRWARQHGVAIRDERGRAVRLVGSSGDITELKRAEQALKESEERYALATRAATEGIYEWDLETGRLFLSERGKQFFSIAGGALTPAAWNEHVHPDDFPGYRKALAAYFSGRAGQYAHEYRVRDAAGGYAWVLDRALAVRDSAGRVVRLVGALSDISQRKEHEIELRRARDEATAALERQTATAEILRVISSTPTDTQPVFDAIVKNAQRVVAAKSAILLLRRRSECFVAAYSAPGLENIAPEVRTVPLDRDKNYPSRVVLDCEVVHIPDWEADDVIEFERFVARSYGIGSGLQVPLVRKGEGIGALVVTRASKGRFPDKEIALLQAFADQAVIAIENVRLFNETREALERQTATAEILKVISSSPTSVQPVFDSIVRSAMQLTGSVTGALYTTDGATVMLCAISTPNREAVEMFRRAYPLPIDIPAPSIQAIRECRVLNVADVLEGDYAEGVKERARAGDYRSALCVPMRSGGRAIGSIGVTRREPGLYDERHVALLKTFADQAVIAIENVRLFNETREALERQTATAEILKVISASTTDTRPVLDAIASTAQRLFDGAATGIALVRGGQIELPAAAGMDDAHLQALRSSFPRPLGLVSTVNRVIERGVVEHHPDVSSGSVPAYTVKTTSAAGVRALLGVPMLREGKPIGGIFLSRAYPGAFTEQQVALLQSFADQAVIAIENVRLFNETKEALERQTASAEILRVIASSPSDVRPVFEAITQGALRVFDGMSVGIALADGDELDVTAIGGVGPFAKRRHPLDRESVTGLAILDRCVVNLRDTEAADAPRYARENGRAAGFRSMAAAPLLREGQAIGAIGVMRRELGGLSDKQLELLATFADQAVIAIENVRLFNETKEALERQTATAEILKIIASSPSDVQPVFDAIVQGGRDLIGGFSASLTRVEGNVIQLAAFSTISETADASVKALYPRPLAAGHPSSEALLTRLPVQIRDIETDAEVSPDLRETARNRGWRSALFVPMLREGEAIGTINVSRREPGPFSQHHVDLLKTFADQAVIAIENVRLFKELQARTEALTNSVEQLTALGEVSQAISSTLDLETVLKTIVSRAVQLTGVDGGSIYEFDAASASFHLRATQNMPEELVETYRRMPIRLGEGIVGRAAQTREPVQVPDIEDASYQTRYKELLLRQGYRAILAVPLAREEQVIGALTVNRNRPGAFAPEVLELLKTFASQSALAIQNARLFREIAEKGQQLEVASQHKSQFLASMSHELRTPLNAILGFNEMILDQVYGELPEDLKAPLENMQASGKHLLRLINNVLDLAKIEAGRMELALSDYSVQDTVASVHSTLKPLAADKGLEFLADVPNDIPLGYGDAGRITQCLMNLAGNSLKFTRQGRVEIAVAHHDGLLRYSVADTGIGIPPEKIGNLFTEFKQTDATIASEYGGTGLGLSISKKFVEMHGGRIWVESEPGQGSTFIVEIPLRIAP
jgi:PAS domain S-box-containing protein